MVSGWLRPDWSLWRRAMAIAAPLMLAESIDSVLWIVDAYFVGLLGDEALAAVGIGGYLGWLVFVGSMMFFMGALVMVSQAVGAGERGLAARIAGETVAANALFGIPVALAAWAAAPHAVEVLSGPRVSPEVKELAVEYFRARLWGVPLTYAAMSMGAVYRGFGVTGPVLRATILYTIANAVLDPVLIFGLAGAPRLGVAGAGYASSIANAVYAIALAAQARASIGMSLGPAVPGRLAARAAALGVPVLLERVVFVAGNLTYLRAVASCGDAALAAHTVGVRVESLAFLPLLSIAEAAAAIVGQEVGAGKLAEAKRSGFEVAKLNFAAGVAAAAVLVALSPWLPAAFTDDPAVRDLARVYLVLAAASEPPFAGAVTMLMALRGAGNTLVPTLVNLGSLYGVRVPVAYTLPGITGLCAPAAWSSMIVDMAARLVLSALIYSRLFERLARRVV